MLFASNYSAITAVDLKVVVVGHVDHGKSTFIGRLLYETGTLPAQRCEEIKAAAERRSMPIEWSFALDALQAERDQAVTIDTTEVCFQSGIRRYVVIDAPGHREFLRNMISGAARADAAMLVVDAAEGLQNQSRLHAYLVKMIGVTQVIVLVNKMDLVGNSERRFDEVAEQIREYCTSIGLQPAHIVPISAREGTNLVRADGVMRWYDGPSAVEALDALRRPETPSDLPLRIPIQDVYHFDGRRIIVGRVESGVLRSGDTVVFSPSNERGAVASIECWPRTVAEAHAGEAVGLTLTNEVFVERGAVISHVEQGPTISDVFRGRIFWLGREDADLKGEYKLKLATQEIPVKIQSIDRIIDTVSLAQSSGSRIQRNYVAEVVLRTRRPIALDPHHRIAHTGRFVLTSDYEIVGGGTAFMDGFPDQRSALFRPKSHLFAVGHRVTPAARQQRNGHVGAVIWFTGLSGSGKSTLAMAVELALFDKGLQVYALDGDNIRHGLNADVGFSPQDRVENIRRVGAVAQLFADAGLIVITALISPYSSDRKRLRERLGSRFHEVYIRASLDACERRDPKGLYRRARAGDISDFTGISAPYEEPEAPHLVVDTVVNDVEESTRLIVEYVERAVCACA
jgi:bifunctional enzyme CysN/CysC